MRVARRYVIAGRVQGVGFRWFAHDAARREGVQGWVRNLADGSVEVVVVAPPDRLRAFVDEMGRGPRGARVQSVNAGEIELTEEPVGFEIRP